jgi:hypothetical protein
MPLGKPQQRELEKCGLGQSRFRWGAWALKILRFALVFHLINFLALLKKPNYFDRL